MKKFLALIVIIGLIVVYVKHSSTSQKENENNKIKQAVAEWTKTEHTDDYRLIDVRMLDTVSNYESSQIMIKETKNLISGVQRNIDSTKSYIKRYESYIKDSKTSQILVKEIKKAIKDSKVLITDREKDIKLYKTFLVDYKTTPKNDTVLSYYEVVHKYKLNGKIKTDTLLIDHEYKVTSK